MIEIYTNLYIGEDFDCEELLEDPGFSIVHACQSCHHRAQDYRSPMPSTHPNYLIYENGSHLYLNLVDTPYEFLPELANPVFKSAMEFIHREIKNKKLLIHCNFGYSRSPSIGMVYLAINSLIPNNSFEEAVIEYLKLYPNYTPGKGIALYLQHNWDFLMKELIV